MGILHGAEERLDVTSQELERREQNSEQRIPARAENGVRNRVCCAGPDGKFYRDD